MTLRPEPDDAARVWDIVQWGDRLARIVEGVTWEQYRNDEEKRLSVERCLEVIGEAARHLSDAFKNRHPHIPWRDIISQRNIIVHGYFELEQDRLWRVATFHAPMLIKQLQPLVEQPPPDPEPDEDAR